MARTIAVDEKAIAGNGDFEPIPEGTKLRVALFDITETTIKSGENKGKAQAEFTVKVTEDGPYKGREVKYNYLPLYAGAGNAWFLVAFAEAVGWSVTKDAEGKPQVELPDDLRDALGTEFIAKFRQTQSQTINPNTGKPYINNRVNGARKIKGGGAITDSAPKSWESL